MKLKFALSLTVLMMSFMSTFAFAENQDYKQAELDWHHAIETFMQEVKAAEGFDYDAGENANINVALDTEVKRLANEEANGKKSYFFFLCEAHKKVMRQFRSASYELVKLSSICAPFGQTIEKWVPIGKKSDKGEYLRNFGSIKSEGNLVFVKDKIVFSAPQKNNSLIYQVLIVDHAIDCNAQTAATTSNSYQSLGGEVVTAFEMHQSEWSFDREKYEALAMQFVCLSSGTPLSNLEALLIVANGGEAVAQYELGMKYLIGHGVAKNKVKAREWLQKAAEQGLTDAQNMLAGMYLTGDGIPEDKLKALEWYQRAASQNHIAAQASIAAMYYEGSGVPKNSAKSAAWYLRAASQGDAESQYITGLNYRLGEGVIKDFVRAYAWLNLAASQGHEKAISSRNKMEKYDLTREQIADGQRLASNWKKGDTFLAPSSAQAAQEPTISATDRSFSPKLSSTGSGFVVSERGYLLTNHHVTDGCSNLKVRDTSKAEHDAIVVATDAKNDLALLKISTTKPLPTVTFRASGSVEAGENVVALGYPLAGVLASAVNVSFGYVSATAGLADDTSKMQISAPVQPGNSGGPLLDQAGNLVGVVVAKLDAIKIAKAIGDIPQNINFAVKGEVAQTFLNAHKIKFKTTTTTKKLENTDIATRGRAFTVLVECYK